MDVFKSNGYPENLINNCFKTFLDNKHRIQEKIITVTKKLLFLVHPYLGPLSLHTRIKLRKSLKGILNYWILQITFKSKSKLANAFRFTDWIPKELTSGVIYNIQCGLCDEFYGEKVRQTNVRFGEHTGISQLTKKKVKPKSSAVSNHLLLCNHSPSFESFSRLTKENRKFVLELKESLVLMKDKPSLNRNIRFAPLDQQNIVKVKSLFDGVQFLDSSD